MYKLTHRPKQNKEQSAISRSRSQYLTQNINPNCLSSNSQISLNCSSKNIKIQYPTNSIKTQSTDKHILNRKSAYKNKPAPKLTPKINRTIDDQDFIMPEDIGIGTNGRAVQGQLYNAMKKQIEKQRVQIDVLNDTIEELKSRDKNNQLEILKLSDYVQRLVIELQQLRTQKSIEEDNVDQAQEVLYLREQNERLQNQMDKMQQIIKSVLLEREKERILNSH